MKIDGSISMAEFIVERIARSQHQALDALSYAFLKKKVNYVLDADIRGLGYGFILPPDSGFSFSSSASKRIEGLSASISLCTCFISSSFRRRPASRVFRLHEECCRVGQDRASRREGARRVAVMSGNHFEPQRIEGCDWLDVGPNCYR
ncbi:MAG: hypothetical protein WCA20_18120 [Candidatus Sulfotelmatobacter sp.]